MNQRIFEHTNLTSQTEKKNCPKNNPNVPTSFFKTRTTGEGKKEHTTKKKAHCKEVSNLEK